MDYAMPRAGDLPSFDLSFAGTRCTTNPVGVKGCGEAGAVALFPAVANAIADAVAVTSLDGPASGNRIWHAMRQPDTAGLNNPERSLHPASAVP
jgi:carbon-monoxide dehydrogenase large subunit